jgi:hypothetical protein
MLAEVQTRADGSQSLLQINCDVPTGAGPGVTGSAVRAQVQRLVPHPSIGEAPPGGVTLVNIQTLLWLGTAPDRDLGTVTIIGQRVGLRVHVVHVAWTFGDGASATTNSPGHRYEPADGCRQARCPQYWGHVYTATGRRTITAQITWSGEFRVGSGAWQRIPGTVTGPRQGAAITVRQARGVLVPNSPDTTR